MTGRAHVHTKIRKYHSASLTRSSNLLKSNSVRVNKVSSCHLSKPRPHPDVAKDENNLNQTREFHKQTKERSIDMESNFNFTYQYHRKSKRRNRSRLAALCCPCCSTLCKTLCLLVATCLLAIMIGTIIILTRFKTTSSTTTTTPKPCTINVRSVPACATWNQTGITVAGNQNGTNATDLISLNFPVTIYVDDDYNLYVSDAYNHRIMKYYPNNRTGTIVAGGLSPGSSALQLNDPKGVAMDRTGAIIVGDSQNYRIQKFSNDSLVGMTVASNSSSSLFGITRDIRVDCYNNIIATDSVFSRIIKFTPDGSNMTVLVNNNGVGLAADQFNAPFGIFIDNDQTLYVADKENHRVQMWPSGTTSGITVAGISGSAGSSLMRLNGPSAVVVDNNGFIYIADSRNHRIVKWTMNYTAGGVCVVGCSGSSGKGSTYFTNPRDLKFDPSGNLYVADQGNHRIQKFMVQTSTSSCLSSG